MTMIGSGTAAFAPPTSNFDAGIRSAMLNISASIMGSFMRPLGAGPFASAQMPPLWNLQIGPIGQPPVAQMTANIGPNGQGSVDLGDGYSLKLNENNSEISVINSNTGETTRIWGDPHVEVDGKHAFDFWGTTSFTLANGTKITINTEQFGGNPNAYVASQLVITKGDQAVTINGISQNDLGDLSVTMGNNGVALDAATRDGYTLTENGAGAGWLAQGGGHVATQSDLNATAVGGLYGPGSGMPSLDELGNAIGTFLLFGLFSGALTTAFVDVAETRGSEARAFNPR
jgi:hypothetical protein